jgi:flagellar biosynthetic protein FliO
MKLMVTRYKWLFALMIVLSMTALVPATEPGKSEDNPEKPAMESKQETVAENKETSDLPTKKEMEPGTLDLPDSESISFLKSLMALSFVLGLIFMAAYLYKRMTGMKTAGFRSNRVPINMAGHLSLGEKKFLSIVEIQGKHYFIGITPDSISLLSQLDLDVPEEEVGSEAEGDFENIFHKARQLLNTKGKKG